MTNKRLSFNPRYHITKRRVIIWLILTGIILLLYFLKHEWFDISLLQGLAAEHRILVMVIYVGVLSVLGLFFIPSTPFAIAGLLLFSPLETYCLNLVGILTSTVVVYYFTRFLGIRHLFEKRYPEKIKKVKQKLEHKELPIIGVWSFIPFVPTDAMIYAASSMHVPLWKCLLGVGIGEGIINLFYLFFAGSLFL